MATASPISENELPSGPGAPASGLLVTLTSLSAEALPAVLDNLALAFPTEDILVATPDPLPPGSGQSEHLHAFTYTPSVAPPEGWVLSAADYLNAYKLMQEHKARACLLLGPESQSIAPEALRALAGAVMEGQADFAVPRYALGPRDGLVNSAILYPATRALFGTRPRYPFAIDNALSLRMAERLASAAQKFTAANQPSAFMWPVSEAASSGYVVAEAPAGTRTLPSPEAVDLNTILAQVAGSFFSDLDAKAGFWQRARLAYSPKAAADHAAAAVTKSPDSDATTVPDIQPMVESFRLAYINLQEIWSLVLPPNSLLGLKKLSLMEPTSFRMPDSLWARIVYDFVLAYRLRTLNRGHLLGALTPLYLAWVASHLLLASGAGSETMAPEQHIESLAAAFEADKPYLVSRWRWPDRFNP